MPPKRDNASRSTDKGVAAAGGHSKHTSVTAANAERRSGASAKLLSAASGQTPTRNPVVESQAELRQQTAAAKAKLCLLVKQHPCLYDPSDPNCANKQVVNAVWEKIANECDEEVSTCKEHWRNLRAAFARSVGIYKTSGGPNLVKPYYLHEELSFLIKYMKKNTEQEDDETDTSTNAEHDAVSVVPTAGGSTNLESEPNLASDETEQQPLGAADGDDSLAEQTKQLQRDSPHAAALSPKLSKPHAQRKRCSEWFRSGESAAKKLHVDNAASDEDVQFLKMLLPHMGAMNPRQKLLFKEKIYKSIREVFDSRADFPERSAAQTGAPPAQTVVTAEQSAQPQVMAAIRLDSAQSQVESPMLPLPIIVKEEIENAEYE